MKYSSKWPLTHDLYMTQALVFLNSRVWVLVPAVKLVYKPANHDALSFGWDVKPLVLCATHVKEPVHLISKREGDCPVLMV